MYTYNQPEMWLNKNLLERRKGELLGVTVKYCLCLLHQTVNVVQKYFGMT